jgi:RNA polymerase sigma-70 factor (ECF subfamily)
MVSVLTRIFGSDNISIAEDVVQDSLLEAIKQWTYKGIPENPSAWLFKVAKNKALNIIHHEKYLRLYSLDLSRSLFESTIEESGWDDIFSEQEIQDDQLRMIFTCCHPSISSDSQIALALKTLCGFSISEIARAFITTDENINKRLVRARQKIRDDKIPFEVPLGKDIVKRVETVLETIYLLFNEGYSASSGTDLIRYEVCEEAIRLAEIISQYSSIENKSNVYALLALMQLNASRFSSRLDADGKIITLEKQNRLLYNYPLMEKGFSNLEKSSSTNEISIYHILATISAYHCSAVEYKATDWKSILVLYDKLVLIDNSPIVLLNRAIALSKVSGAEKAILELEQIKSSAILQSNHLFYSTQAELFIELNQISNARKAFEMAIQFAPLDTEKEFLQNRLSDCCKIN